MKKIIILIITILFVSFNFYNIEASSFTYGDEVEVMFIGDLETGNVLYKKNYEKVLPVASMSKLMTYLVVRDNIEEKKINYNDVVRITKESSDYNISEYSSMGLNEGDEVTVEELLKGLMVVSGNDATVALAIHVSGSQDEFVKLMNLKAEEIGLLNSNFINVSGLTEETSDGLRYNTMNAKDLFNLTKYIINKYPDTYNYEKISELNIRNSKYTGYSTLPARDLASIAGLKTGYTEEAGYCFTGLFEMSKENEINKYKLVSIVMGAKTEESREVTTKELVEYVKRNYTFGYKLDLDIPIVDIYDKTLKSGKLELYPERNINKLVPINFNEKYEIFEIEKNLYEEGEILGKLIIENENGVFDRINLVNKDKIKKANIFEYIINSIYETFFNIKLEEQ